jgi:hypothetical protein
MNSLHYVTRSYFTRVWHTWGTLKSWHKYLEYCKIWAFHGGDYEECRLLGYKNPVRTSQETHYVSTTQSSRLKLCKIRGFHGGDYEECHLLGYKNPVRTSQETHYVSGTQSSRLKLCKIRGFHRGDYEECRLLGYKNPVRTSQETHHVSDIQSSRLKLLRFEVFTAVTMKNAVFWDIKTQFVVPSSTIFVTLKLEALGFSASVRTRATRRNMPEDVMLQYYFHHWPQSPVWSRDIPGFRDKLLFLVWVVFPTPARTSPGGSIFFCLGVFSHSWQFPILRRREVGLLLCAT